MDSAPEIDPGASASKRALKLLYLSLLFALIIASRLFYLQIVEHQFYTDLSYDQRLRIITLSPDRGDIFDRNGNVLATSINAYSVGAFPSEVMTKEAVASTLSVILKDNKASILKKLNSDKPFVWIKRKIEEPLAKKIIEKNIPGIAMLPEKKRVYPGSKLASSVVGFVGLDNQGLSGIEYSFDPYLKGEEGSLTTERDLRGRDIMTSNLRELKAPTNGMTLTLTIDETVQYKAESEIKKAVQTSNAKSGSVIVMDVKSGEILALASYPDFDPNDYQKYKQDEWNNRVVKDVYEPGSTFKLVTVASGLENGVITKNSLVYCPDKLELGGRVIKNSHESKENNHYLPVSEILRESINTGAANIAIKMGKDRFFRSIKDFGFGDYTDVGLPGESRGILNDPSTWNKPDIATISFGQTIAVTPIQLLSSISALANGGRRVKPILVKKIESVDTDFIRMFVAEDRGQVVSPQTAKDMMAFCEDAVENGTGHLAKIPFFRVGGKTGTAQKHKEGSAGYIPGHYISSFIGFTPMSDPRIAVLVIIDDPQPVYWGERVAAPVFKDVAEYSVRRLNIAPDKEEKSVI